MEPDQEARVVRGKPQPSINRPFFFVVFVDHGVFFAEMSALSML
jgi:hypothetical protein